MKLELNHFRLKNPNCNEVELFQHMSDYLSKRYRTVFIEETHQQYVGFVSPLTKCRINRREISDIWIITYSKKQKKVKMTFLQAKYVRNKKIIPHPFRFSGDFFQYDLLANRPNIINRGSSQFPSGILKNAISDSVGTYGIFYNDDKNRLDFSFSVAVLFPRLFYKNVSLIREYSKNEWFATHLFLFLNNRYYFLNKY